MAATVACVLRSGGDYSADDVRRLKEGVEANLPGANVICISDVPVPCERIPIREWGWMGWWAKMALFSPDMRGDFLYLDLDTIPIGDLSDLAGLNRLAILRDFMRPNGLQSACMFLPESERAAVWSAFTADPYGHMKRHGWGGDQAFLETLWIGKAALIQDILPGQCVSYKKHVKPLGRVPEGARAVIFHGKPRPAGIGWELPR